MSVKAFYCYNAHMLQSASVFLILPWLLTLPMVLHSLFVFGEAPPVSLLATAVLPALCLSPGQILLLIPCTAILIFWISPLSAGFYAFAALCAYFSRSLMASISPRAVTTPLMLGLGAGVYIWLTQINPTLVLCLYLPFIPILMILWQPRLGGVLAILLLFPVAQWLFVNQVTRQDRVFASLRRMIAPAQVLRTALSSTQLRGLVQTEPRPSSILLPLAASPFSFTNGNWDWTGYSRAFLMQFRTNWPLWYVFRGESGSWLLGFDSMASLRASMRNGLSLSSDSMSEDDFLGLLLKEEANWHGLATPVKQVAPSLQWPAIMPKTIQAPQLNVLHRTPMRLLYRELPQLTGDVPTLAQFVRCAENLLASQDVIGAEGVIQQIARHPKNEWHYSVLRAKVLIQLQAYDEAARILERVVRRQNPADGEHLLLLATTLGEAEARHIPHAPYDYQPIVNALTQLNQQYPSDLQFANLLMLYSRKQIDSPKVDTSDCHQGNCR